MEERLQKIIASAGLCSRRAAEDYLRAGRVTVNGRAARLGDRADGTRDEICLDGKPIGEREAPVYLMLHKPRGYTCTLSDSHAAHPVTELLAGCGARVYPVGRLDVDSEGLLLLTNDGALSHRLLHPRFGAEKVYHVTVAGLRPDSIQRLRTLREIDGERIRPVEVELLRAEREAVLSFTLREGKKRQIRRMCRRVGLSVRRLCRVAEHGVLLGDLPVGGCRPLTEEEVAQLRAAVSEAGAADKLT